MRNIRISKMIMEWNAAGKRRNGSLWNRRDEDGERRNMTSKDLTEEVAEDREF